VVEGVAQCDVHRRSGAHAQKGTRHARRLTVRREGVRQDCRAVITPRPPLHRPGFQRDPQDAVLHAADRRDVVLEAGDFGSAAASASLRT
jgi:hypothetical protein